MLRLFEGVGVELEYMIVASGSMDVRPIADRLLASAARGEVRVLDRAPRPDEVASDADLGPITWSNELVLHVLEMKTTTPARGLDGLAAEFQSSIRRANAMLGPAARLMPGAMHAWMDPAREMVLWPHDNAEIYAAFDRIFSCRGHGWSNLQSMHLNFPFEGDDEFGRLHAGMRVLLPILPALAASSPIVEGRRTGALDTRLETYRHNSRRVPSVAGRVIPERAFTREAYEREILGRIYADMRPLDPAGLLRDEWANARGCIARFGRGSIEIRVLDVQECPIADLSIAAAVDGALRALVEERWSSAAAQGALEVEPLAAIFERAIRGAEATIVDDEAYLRVLGLSGPMAAREVWASIIERTLARDNAKAWALGPLGVLTGSGDGRGCLARRMLAWLAGAGAPVREGEPIARPALVALASRLSACLERGEMLAP